MKYSFECIMLKTILLLAIWLFVTVKAAADRDEVHFELAYDLLNHQMSDSLNADELLPLFKVANPSITKEKILELIESAELNKDGTIDKREWVEVLKKKFSSKNEFLNALALEKHKEDDSLSGEEVLQILLEADIGANNEEKDAKVIFALIDKDNDGLLTTDEIKEFAPQYADDILKADTDGDGELSPTELQKLLDENSELKKEIVKHIIDTKYD